jgi:hypothetical protein
VSPQHDFLMPVLLFIIPLEPIATITHFTSFYCRYLEKERDFYFSKLRQIEILCQTQPQGSVDSQKVLGILWSEE